MNDLVATVKAGELLGHPAAGQLRYAETPLPGAPGS